MAFAIKNIDTNKVKKSGVKGAMHIFFGMMALALTILLWLEAALVVVPFMASFIGGINLRQDVDATVMLGLWLVPLLLLTGALLLFCRFLTKHIWRIEGKVAKRVYDLYLSRKAMRDEDRAKNKKVKKGRKAK